MPHTKIISALLLCSLIFVGVFFPCLFMALKLVIGHINFVGGGSTSFKPQESLIFWICVVAIILSFLIHPYGAYRIKDNFNQLTSSVPLRTVFFVLFAGFQLILIASAYGAELAKNHFAEQQRIKTFRAHKEIVAMLDNAKVEVLAKTGRVVADDGKYVLVEVTLEIKNVPLSLPYYEMNIHQAGQDGRFFTASVRQTNESILNPYLKVTSTGGKWVFTDLFTKQTVSDDAQNVKLQFEFSRVKAAMTELPDTITPRLGIWDRDDKIYSQTYLFFYKPIPVIFERLPN